MVNPFFCIQIQIWSLDKFMSLAKKISLYCVSIFFSTLLSIFALELLVRLVIDDGFNYELEMMKYAKMKIVKQADEHKVFLHKPNMNEIIMRANIITDNNGFRYNQQNKNKDILMMLGDSMTFGFGSSYTFSDYIQENLQEKFKVLNTGVGNTNTKMQEVSFFEFHKNHNPKILILNFFINDLEDISVNKKNFIKNNFYIFSYLNYKYNIIKLKFSKNLTFSNYYKKTFENKTNLNQALLSIKKLKIYSEKNNINFFVHFIPELHKLKDYPFLQEHKIIQNYLSKNDIKYIDGIKYFKDLNENELWVSKHDTHANEKAHKIMGRYLLNFLEKEIF